MGFSDRFANKLPVEDSEDLRRILVIPRRKPLDLESEEAQEVADYVTSLYRRDNPNCQCSALAEIDGTKRGCMDRLRPVQAQMLLELSAAGGLLGAIGVGHGKTLPGILAVYALGVQSAVILVPPQVLPQLFSDYAYVSQHFRVPSIVEMRAPGRSGSIRKVLQPGEPTLYVIAYSTLSLPASSILLEQINPDAMILDEADRVMNLQSATTIRLLRYLNARMQADKPVKVAAWTGSLTKESILDYQHLALYALGENSPLPLDLVQAASWADALLADGVPAPPGALRALCVNGFQDVAEGYRLRLSETLGVVITREASAPTKITILERNPGALPHDLQRLLLDVRNRKVRPDGEELTDPREVAAVAANVSCGFHYYWHYPRNEPIPLRDRWFAARQAWNCEVREKIERREPHLDSPALCYRAAERYYAGLKGTDKKPVWGSATWQAWSEVRDQVKPVSRARRLDDYLVQDAAKWARENVGIVWYDSTEFGLWLSEVSGLSLHTGGKNAGERITAERGNRAIIASLHAHGRGRDSLQYKFASQLIAEPPASATTWEQLLGRLHRPGQKLDVHAYVYTHTRELRRAVDKALARGQYVNATLGIPQKLRITVPNTSK